MKYVCSVCGYVYDEEKEGVPFTELPDGWACPLCRADKDAFAPEAVKETVSAPVTPIEIDSDMFKLSPGALAAVFSNLARGCEKQYKAKEQALFQEIADYFTSAAPQISEADEKTIAALVSDDVQAKYPLVKATAEGVGDRGSQRICVWGEKVTRMIDSLLSRYEKEGEAFLQNAEVWVCTVCGFIYIGESAPTLCPVCKVPDWKFEKIEGRVSA